ncbi:uncharacterized protein LOC62_03G003949 [Vanrija pseudolonga]|uniref:Uncharacterized protein n=1 Tax=Vanrija pseudolonga TaxID=143232 RepID=A0AAF1BJZ5_9TREE|nr:hypothetical protein LOC62_03G003949 [Vanrija pseudolonga]
MKPFVSLVLAFLALAAHHHHHGAAATPIALAGDNAPAAAAPAIVWPTFVGPVKFTPAKAGLTPPEGGKPITARGGAGDKHSHHRG